MTIKLVLLTARRNRRVSLEVVCVVWRVVVHYVLWVVRVNLVDVLAQLAALLGINFLYFLETAGLHEGTLRLQIGWKHFRKLSTHVSKDVVGSKLEEGFESRQVGAHLNDVLQRFLRFVFKVLGAF